MSIADKRGFPLLEHLHSETRPRTRLRYRTNKHRFPFNPRYVCKIPFLPLETKQLRILRINVLRQKSVTMPSERLYRS